MKSKYRVRCLLFILSILSCLPTSADSLTVYGTVSLPNKKLRTCTLGVVWLGQYRHGDVGYRAYASYIARNWAMPSQIAARPRYKFVEVFIFEDMASATAFRDYQAKRQSRPLQTSDYLKLTHLWRKTLAYCALTSRSKTLSTPRREPSSWWRTLPNIAMK
jgi:hypothetical protein